MVNKAELEEAKSQWSTAFTNREYEWLVKWLDKYTIKVTRQYNEPTRTKFLQLENLYPFYKYPYVDRSSIKGNTSQYVIIGNVIIKSSPGPYVIKVGSLTQSWEELTVEELACLKDNKIPFSLQTV